MKKKSLKINALLNIIYTVSNIVFPMITFPYVSRVLQVDYLGKVNFFTNIASYATMVAALGISTYGIRAVARSRGDKKELSRVVSELLTINGFATAVVVAALLCSSVLINRFRQDYILLLLNCLQILATPIGMNWLFSGLEEYSYITKRSLCVKTVSLVCVFLFVRDQSDYFIYAAILVLSAVLGYVWNFVYAHKFVRFQIHGLNVKRHIRPILILFGSILAINVYTHLDTIMLGFFNGDKDVGLYTTAVYIKTALLTLVNAISAVLLPRISYYVREGKAEEIESMLNQSISVICMIALPLTIFFIACARETILVLGGEGYLEAVPCMIIIMPVLLISGFSNITGNQILIPLEKDGCFMKAVICGAVADLLLNMILMPRYGCIGAAVATLVAELLQMSIQLYFARDYVRKSINRKSIVKIVIAAMVSSLSFLLVTQFHGAPLLTLAVSAVLYFAFYAGMMLVLRETYFISTLEQFKHILSQK